MSDGSELCNWYYFDAEISDRRTFSLFGVWLAADAWPNKMHQQTEKNMGQLEINVVKFNLYVVPYEYWFNVEHMVRRYEDVFSK